MVSKSLTLSLTANPATLFLFLSLEKPYLYESRHAHAMRRPRGKGGRFLTAQEIEELKSKGEGEISGGSSNPTHNQEISSNFNLQGDEDGNVWNLKL